MANETLKLFYGEQTNIEAAGVDNGALWFSKDGKLYGDFDGSRIEFGSSCTSISTDSIDEICGTNALELIENASY